MTDRESVGSPVNEGSGRGQIPIARALGRLTNLTDGVVEHLAVYAGLSGLSLWHGDSPSLSDWSVVLWSYGVLVSLTVQVGVGRLISSGGSRF
jgi:hypothetical protein